MLAVFLVSFISFSLAVYANNSYSLKDTYAGNDFYTKWKWETFDDPTHGRVNYLGRETAIAKGLAYVQPDGVFVMKADSKSVVPPGSRGRDSIRITSLEAYDKALFVAKISHMPVGCGTWPAFWTLSQRGPWPNGGEIDIIEGVHENKRNLATLHTTPQCTVGEDKCGDRSPFETGLPVSLDCNTAINGNQGCGVEFQSTSSYGREFNQNGGGYFVMEKGSPIRVWFLSPGEQLFDGSGTISVDDLPKKPDAYFPTDENCDYASHFDAHAMIFDLTFCGDWAGNTFTSAGCGQSCIEFVDNNPQAFDEAYWTVDYVKVYTKDVGVSSVKDSLLAQGPGYHL